MSKLSFVKVGIYFLIAALTVVVAQSSSAHNVDDWLKLSLSGLLSGLVAVRAFVDRSYATDVGAPTEAPAPAPTPQRQPPGVL